MEHHGPTSWLLTLPLLPHEPKYMHVNAGILLFLAITVFSLLANRLIKGNESKYLVPPAKWSLVGFADVLVEALYGMIAGTLGPADGKKYFPFIASVFVFVFFGNLMGLLPFGSAPTSNPNTTFAVGIASFLYYNYMDIKSHGLGGYLHHFLMGLGPWGIFVAFFEIISHVLRPFTLGLRLFLNLQIDHTVVHTFQDLCAWLLPVPLLLFGIVVCTIQAFVFATLTAVYVQLATEHEHAESH